MTGHEIPYFFKSKVEELSRETRTISIWLIGSRANDTATELSDWDLLVLQDEKATFSDSSIPQIDIIRANRDRVQTEGVKHSFDFTHWNWSQTSDVATVYLGRSFTGCVNELIDCTTPRYVEKKCKEIILWNRTLKDTLSK